MQFLTYPERFQLQRILTNNTVLQTADMDLRTALLKNCGLGEYCSLIPLEKPSFQFVIILCEKLSEIHISVGASEKLGLVVFLEYINLVDPNLSSEERSFISHVITKWEQWQTSKTQKLQGNQIATLLAQYRKESPVSTPNQQPIKVDHRAAIVNFDLENQMAKFRQQVGYEGAFVFAVGGNDTILEQYIIERIRQELKRKTERQQERFEIRLYRDSILTSTDIERKFIERYQFECFTDLFNAQLNTDIVLIIWNYDIPQTTMKSVAQSFWTTMNSWVLPFLQNQSRCFVLVWANVGKRPLAGFTALPTPDKFDLSELLPWFRSQLRMQGIREDDIDNYLHRLEDQRGHLIGTYQEMNQIIHELQGGLRRYG